MTLQEQLTELRQLDARVRGMSQRQNAATRRFTAQSDRLQLLRRQRAELESQQKIMQAKATTLEKKVAEMDARVATLRDKMNSVTSNKEYSAMLLEVNTLKVDKGKAEDEALEQMAQVEALRKRIEEAAQKVADQEKLVAGAEKEVAEAKTEVGAKLDEATAARDAAAEKISPDVLAVFNRLAEQFDGEAVCEIEEQDRRRMEYTCGGCYMTVPVERVNGLIMRPDEMIQCPNPNCGRILTINAELKTAIGAK